MSMEPFDYLTYKKNKSLKNPPLRDNTKNEKIKTTILCIVTFFAIFIPALSYIASKSSKMDIEYGRLGKDGETPYASKANVDEPENYDDIDDKKPAKYTIDKRLFLIMQEEKGPSESRVIQTNKEQTEVISKEQFEKIKNNGDEFIERNTDKQDNETKQEKQPEAKPVLNDTPNPQKPVIKPKIPPKPVIKPVGLLEVQTPISKVLIGRYATIEEAKQAQAGLSSVVQGGNPYVKRVGSHYSIQIGAYDNFETAKSIAARLQARGLEAWVLQ